MSGIIQRLKDRTGRFLSGKFDPNRASEEAGIKWLMKGAYLSDRLDTISNITFNETLASEIDDFLSSFNEYNTALPWLRAKDDQENRKALYSFYRLYTLFILYRRSVSEVKRRRRNLLELITLYPERYNVNEETLAHIHSILQEDDTIYHKESPPLSLTELEAQEAKIELLASRLPIEISSKINAHLAKTLQQFVNRKRLQLMRYAKEILMNTFTKEDLEPGPPIVISKPQAPPERVQMPPQMRSSREFMEMQTMLTRLDYKLRQRERLDE